MKRPQPLTQQLVALLAATNRHRLRAKHGALVLWAAPAGRKTARAACAAELFAIILTGTLS